MEPQKYAAIMQNEMIAEIEKSHPPLLIYVDVPLSWLPQDGANMYIFDWLRNYLAQNYRLMAVDKSTLNPLGERQPRTSRCRSRRGTFTCTSGSKQ